MNLLRYVIIAILILNLPSAALKFGGGVIGSLLSASSLLLMLVYYVFCKRTEINIFLLAIGFTYYLISSFNFRGNDPILEYIPYFIKYILVVICGYEVAKKTTKSELFWFLLIGSLSILIHAVLFTDDYGRYSGLYFNPNVAGFICISGYGLTYALKNKKMALIGQFIYTLAGLLTFSRTFIVLWILINILSFYLNLKNIKILFVGLLIFSSLIFIDETIGLNNPRFDQLISILNNEKVYSSDVNENSRTETWAYFYKYIFDKPIFGNGYGAFQGGGVKTLGSHNTYLLIIGEAGIIPFFLFIIFIFSILKKGVQVFKKKPHILMMVLALALFLMANHTFFNFYYQTFIAMWIYSEAYSSNKTLTFDSRTG